MTRVVLDTNVYISAVMFGGLPGSLLTWRFFEPSRSSSLPPCLMNSMKSCRQNLKCRRGTRLFCARLESVAHVVKPRETLSVIIEDPDDNRVLECAVKGEADVIVSGDRHLLRLANYQDIAIVTVRQFLESAEATQNEWIPTLPLFPAPGPSFRTEQADFFFRIRSCECVGLRREKSLFSFPFLVSDF